MLVLSLIALIVYGVNLVLLYLLAVSALAAFAFWRAALPKQGKREPGAEA